jgi:membrane-associated HD superfamily phosphohydrolase
MLWFRNGDFLNRAFRPYNRVTAYQSAFAGINSGTHRYSHTAQAIAFRLHVSLCGVRARKRLYRRMNLKNLKNICSRNGYMSLLAGHARMPENPQEKILFQAMMVCTMVTCLTTFNEFQHNGSSFLASLASHLYLYPLTFCIAFTIRTLIGNPITERVIGSFVAPRFHGISKTAMVSLTNIMVMATIVGAFGTLLSGHVADFASMYIGDLPSIWISAFLVNFLVAGPLVKTIFAHIVPDDASGSLGQEA